MESKRGAGEALFAFLCFSNKIVQVETVDHEANQISDYRVQVA